MRARRFRQLRQAPPAEAGFTLVEVVVALVLLTMVATAAFMLFIRVLQSSKGMDSRTAAVTVAQKAMDQARSVTPAFDATFHSKMVGGRQQSAVTAQFAAPPVGVDVSGTYPDYDPTATSTSTPVIPLTSTVTVSNQTYNVATLIGQCVLTQATGVCGKTIAGSVAPLPSTLAAGTTLVERVIVSVTWSNGNSCATAAACSYTVATLIDPSADIQFRMYILRANNDILQDPCTFTSPAAYSCVTQLGIQSNDQGNFGVGSLHQVAAPAHGSVNWTVPGGNPAVVTYTPTDCTATTYAFSGLDTFQYNATDIKGNTTNTATVNVTVVPPQQLPTPGTQTPTWTMNASSTGASTSLNAVPLGSNGAWCAARTAVTGLALTSTVPTGAPVTLTAGGTGSGSTITATPPAGWSGKVNFSYTLTDAFGRASAPLTGTLTVAPTASAVSGSVNQNGSTSLSLLGVGSGLTYSLGSAPSHGTATISGSMLTYTPTPGWPGGSSAQSDTFSYQVLDAAGQTALGPVSISVIPPLPPVATGFKVASCQKANKVSTFDFATTYSGYVSYPNGASLTAPVSASVGNVAGSSVSVSGSTVTFTTGGTKATSGKTLFSYWITDSLGQGSTAVNVTC
jgi:prepilin-type N-terminal cleavage/methylation domain-containing protein